MSMDQEVCAKLTFNISAFNGNTTTFNRCPNPTPKSVPVQPRQEVPLPSYSYSANKGGLIRPL